MAGTVGRGVPTPQCPLRPGDPCTLCQVDVSGPHDCPLVYLAMSDPDLREQLRPDRRAAQDD
jgi:hypothetical protein